MANEIPSRIKTALGGVVDNIQRHVPWADVVNARAILDAHLCLR